MNTDIKVAEPLPQEEEVEFVQVATNTIPALPTNIWFWDGLQRSISETGQYGTVFCDKILQIPPVYLRDLATLLKFRDQDEMLVAILLFHLVMACFFPLFLVYEMTLFMLFITKSTQRVKVACNEDEFWRFFLISSCWIMTKFIQVLVLVSPLAPVVTFLSWVMNVGLTAAVIFLYYGSTFTHLKKKA